MYRVLLIDDDRDLCALIRQCALADGMEADVCLSGREGLEQLRRQAYQLVVLDLMLPGMDGFAVLDEIRAASRLPVLMLTARDDSSSKVRGLRAGADDYLTKPFLMEELTARMASLIRRYTRFNQPQDPPGKLHYTGLEIDPEGRCITTAGGPFELPRREFDVLMLLARHQGRILTKQQIYEAVWQEPYCYDDSNIMAVISRLRKKLESAPGAPQYIQTIKGIGYRFNREV